MIVNKGVIWLILISILLLSSGVDSSDSNQEVKFRILDRLSFYFSGPVNSLTSISTFYENGGFPMYLAAPDRDIFFMHAHSLGESLIYFGDENG